MTKIASIGPYEAESSRKLERGESRGFDAEAVYGGGAGKGHQQGLVQHPVTPSSREPVTIARPDGQEEGAELEEPDKAITW